MLMVALLLGARIRPLVLFATDRQYAAGLDADQYLGAGIGGRRD